MPNKKDDVINSRCIYRSRINEYLGKIILGAWRKFISGKYGKSGVENISGQGYQVSGAAARTGNLGNTQKKKIL